MTTKPCTKCQCNLVWDATAPAPISSQRFKDGKLGWFREDLSKQLHYMDRCNNFQKSKEFMTEPQSIQNAQTNPDIKSAPSPLVKEMDVTDFALNKILKEDQVNLKIIYAREQLVIGFFHSLGIKEPNPARVGLYINNLREMNEE